MAEIKIEKKKPVWPWVFVGLALIALLLYFFVFNDKKEAAPETSNLINVHENNDTVAAYIALI